MAVVDNITIGTTFMVRTKDNALMAFDLKTNIRLQQETHYKGLVSKHLFCLSLPLLLASI